MSSFTEVSLRDSVHAILNETDVVDIHTHLHDPGLGPLLLWGIDDLVTYHYLVAEVLRARPDMGPEAFWALSKSGQADLIWTELFVKRSPISEACRGILTVLHSLGLDPNVESLSEIRGFFADQSVRSYVNRVFELGGVRRVYMTNDPLDPDEGPRWMTPFERDPRFLGVLRLDSAIVNWPEGSAKLRAAGYDVEDSLSEPTIAAIRRYLNDWAERLDARYMAVSLPPTFNYPDPDSPLTTLLDTAVFPTARERKIPVAMMIGVRKLANPKLRLAGDSLGKMDVSAVERLAEANGDIKFLFTILSRENQHELCVAARKYSNILPFGCWWFLNNPSLVREITAMRLELLGLSCVPQHSDARVLDQLIYKWTHSREIIADVLADHYQRIARTGWEVTEEAIRRDVEEMFDGRLMG